MARVPQTKIDDTSLPYRVVIDFLEGTLRKQDAIAFARGFIEHHFDSLTNSGYFVAPYEGGYIFEAHEGGGGRAYLPGILQALSANPSASACVQMARRVLEIKRSSSGIYTSILLPEGTEPQNPDKVFPDPGPKLIPFQRSGMRTMVAGFAVLVIGFLALFLSTLYYLVEVSGMIQPPLASVDYDAMPVRQWPSLKNLAGTTDADKYIRTLRYDNGKWHSDTGERKEEVTPVVEPSALPPANVDPLAPPGVNAPAPGAPVATPPGATPYVATPPVASPPVATPPAASP
jgi:hypothetical protein